MPRAELYRLDAAPATAAAGAHEAPLRLALAAPPGEQAQALVIVQACCPAPHYVQPFGSAPPVQPDAVLLWWRSGSEGLTRESARNARASGIPLIALCGGGHADQSAALYAGADAACGLPVQPPFLRALIDAYRRTAAQTLSTPEASAAHDHDVLHAGPIHLDLRAHSCLVGGQPLDLTLKEFDLLAYFLARAGVCCSRDELLEQVWGLDFDPGSNSVDVFVYTLRRKLKALGFSGVIQTVRGVGYRLVPPASAPNRPPE